MFLNITLPMVFGEGGDLISRGVKSGRRILQLAVDQIPSSLSAKGNQQQKLSHIQRISANAIERYHAPRE